MSAEERVSSVASRVYKVPTSQPEADGTLEWTSTSVVTAEVTAGRHRGIGWTYAAGAAQRIISDELAGVLVGRDPFDVPAAQVAMVRACRNFGRPGVVACAISAVDVALWDLKARLLGTSLTRLFGRSRASAPLYGSGGFTSYDDATMVDELEHWVYELGIPRTKIKVAESWGTRTARDLARIELARKVIGENAELYVDANGGYQRAQAIRIGARFVNDYSVTWFEEPVSSDDLAGLSEVRHHLGADVAAGEYGFDEAYFARMLDAGAVDCLQVDVTRCGGYTSWARAAALAQARGLDVSAHCAPNLHAHIGPSVPNLRHVEYFKDHVRLDAMLFDGLPRVAHGELWIDADQPGHGMSLREPGAEAYRVA